MPASGHSHAGKPSSHRPIPSSPAHPLARSNSSTTSPPLTSSPRAPNPAKRVPRSPTDELRSAVNRDALKSETTKVAQGSEPGVQVTPGPAFAATTPPASPTMAAKPATPATRSMMPRNPSIDSTVSITSNSSKLNARTIDPVRLEDIATLVTDAGSAEAAILKLLNEKSQTASHNAQLWRLVEKQRAMILGLNKDLEKALKEKEKYRKRAKDQLLQSESAPSLTSANRHLQQLVGRQGSQSPSVQEASPLSIASASVRGISVDSRKVSETSDTASYMPARNDTPLDASNAPSSALPTTPQSTDGAPQILRDMQLAEAAATSAQENRAMTQSPTSSPLIGRNPGSPRMAGDAHKKSMSISSLTSSPTPIALSSATKNAPSRKAPPAPLKLPLRTGTEPAAPVANMVNDLSDSEYEDDPDSARAEQAARGRRKTREEDDRDREFAAAEEFTSRSRSRNDPMDRYLQAFHPRGNLSDASTATLAPPSTAQANDPPASTEYPANAAPIVRQQVLAYDPTSLPKSSTAPSLMSPGLPMSPRPGDRPINSPMPRPPNKSLNSVPMSPGPGLPLSLRAPRQAIPMPAHTSLFVPSSYTARSESLQIPQPLPSVVATELAASPQSTPEHEQPMHFGNIIPMTPGEIYQGFVSEQYPEVLLPPNALPSIYIKTASSRMKPSRQSFLAPKTADDNPVFTLAVHERSSKKQLWRVEKTFLALSHLDEELRATFRPHDHGFQERLPDKTLFSGHAPARIDARRTAMDVYFDRLLDSVTDDRPAMVICSFLSTDAIGSDSTDYFGGSVDLRVDAPPNQRPRREGYLTKRGKNFGGWKARYFVLDGPIFKYFDTQGGAQLGSIKLQNAQIGKQSNASQTSQEDEDNQFRHAFLILEPKKKDSTSLVRHVLCAESDEERDNWVDALLQYVDYGDDSGEVASKTHLSAKTNMVPPRSPRLQKSLNDLRPPSRGREMNENKQDQLRGHGYSDMVAGDAPVMGLTPHHPRAGERSLSPHDGSVGTTVHGNDQSSLHPAISNPTNLQVISNTGDWGMKVPPPTPQSKDKKRNIFGFRGRSSSDLGPHDKPSSSSLSDQIGGHPIRAAFGAPLADAVAFARPADVFTELPAVVFRCIEYLTAKNALAEEGIFRLSGSNTVVKGLKDRFNAEGDVNLLAEGTYYDMHAVASLLKLFLRELPSNILTRELHLDFMACQEKQAEEKVSALNALVHRLPRANRALLEALSSLLLSIVSNAEVNKMNIRNVGIVFAPTLNVPAPLISSFVEDHDVIFGPPLETIGSSISSTTIAASQTNATDVRSPRKQMFSDLPTPTYNQTSFRSLGVTHNDDTGMIPVNPTYYQVAPQGEGGFGSLNDALKAPTAYNVASNGVPSSRETKAR